MPTNDGDIGRRVSTTGGMICMAFKPGRGGRRRVRTTQLMQSLGYTLN